MVVIIAGLLVVLAGLYGYFSYDPSNSVFFPKCPFKLLTGWDCAGCGSQRAIHYLLHGDFVSAWQMNPLLFVVVPYAAVGFVTGFFRGRRWADWILKRLYGRTVGIIAAVVIVAYTILRNLL